MHVTCKRTWQVHFSVASQRLTLHHCMGSNPYLVTGRPILCHHQTLCSPKAVCSSGLRSITVVLLNGPLACMEQLPPLCCYQYAALLLHAAFSIFWEALRGEPVCWTGGWLADRRDTEGQQATHLVIKRLAVVGCAPLRYVRLGVGQGAVTLSDCKVSCELPGRLIRLMWCCA